MKSGDASEDQNLRYLTERSLHSCMLWLRTENTLRHRTLNEHHVFLLVRPFSPVHGVVGGILSPGIYQQSENAWTSLCRCGEQATVTQNHCSGHNCSCGCHSGTAECSSRGSLPPATDLEWYATSPTPLHKHVHTCTHMPLRGQQGT